MKSFDKWVDELREQVNKKPELPDGIVEGNVDGEFLYQCRACGDWNPIDWDLDEDSYDGHYCGKQPSCCPLTPGAAPGTTTGRVGGQPQAAPPPPPKAPKAGKATHVICSGCNMRVARIHTVVHPMTGEEYCGANNCQAAIAYKHVSKGYNAPPPAPASRPTRAGMMHCPGCNQMGPINTATMHKPTGMLYCGSNACRSYMDNLGVPKAPPPPVQPRPVAACAGCNVSLTNDQVVYDKVTGAPTCGRHTCMAFVQKRSKLF